VWEVNDLPTPEFPNNYIAPFFTDLTISDNDFEEVTGVAFVCDETPTEACVACNCVNGNDAAACHQSSPFSCEDGAGDPDPSGHWEPCECKTVHRPRGRLLYATVGDEPERKFVVEWLNAKNVWTGNIATFQVQLWEEGSKVLFLYNEFKTKAFWEDPPHDTAYVLNPALVVGMEDFYGQLGIGQAWAPALRYGTWELFNPFDEGDAWGFCVPAYDANGCTIDPWQ
jgi:hypothetical protein